LSTLFFKALFKKYQSTEFKEFFTRSVSLSQSQDSLLSSFWRLDMAVRRVDVYGWRGHQNGWC